MSLSSCETSLSARHFCIPDLHLYSEIVTHRGKFPLGSGLCGVGQTGAALGGEPVIPAPEAGHLQALCPLPCWLWFSPVRLGEQWCAQPWVSSRHGPVCAFLLILPCLGELPRTQGTVGPLLNAWGPPQVASSLFSGFLSYGPCLIFHRPLASL